MPSSSGQKTARPGQCRLPDPSPEPAHRAGTGSHGGTIATDDLFNGRFECTSRHNVHDNRHGNYLIERNDRSRNDRSRRCYRSHVK